MSIKYIIRCAVASLAFFVTASCDMSEIVDSESLSRLRPAVVGDSVDSDIIAFSMAADTATKALDVTTANMTAFEVTAFTHGTTTNPYFNAVSFTGGSGTFASDTPHYWPSSGALDFYAWSVGSATGQVVKNSYKSFTVTPAANPAQQVDLVFACSNNRTKAGASGGVIPLAFAKTMSRVSVKVKNSSSDYKFQVTGWKVGYVATNGTFTYSGSGTSVGTQLPSSMWSGNTTRSADRSYSSTFSTVNVAANTSTAVTLPGEMVLIPQSGAAATAYASASTGAALNGSYIAVTMAILDAATNTVIELGTQCVWPVDIDWEPGKGYSYTIDLSGCGYHLTNQADTDAALDRVFSVADMVDAYFTVVALEAGTITYNVQETSPLQYSKNGGAWADYSESISVAAGDKVRFKGTNGTVKGTSSAGAFAFSNNVNMEGNIMSLLYGDGFAGQTTLETRNTFEYLFYQQPKIYWAKCLVLPAETLSNYCYRCMFYGCSSLRAAPALPATTLAQSCYSYMFLNCRSLITAPELPATTLANNCYSNMFYYCTNLRAAPELPATTLAQSCYYDMFYYCTNLRAAPELPATTLAQSCYYGMFFYCTNLLAAPELPATTLAQQCYYNMFSGCRSLTTAPELPATTLEQQCYSGMFLNCTSLTTAPELPATTLVSNCYQQMFSGCSSLNYIKALFTTTPTTSYTNNWVSGVAATGTFVKSSDATWDVTGNSGIPTGWTVETVTP